MIKTTLYAIGGLLGLGAFLFALQAFGMVSYSFFGKWGEQIRHDIQKESQAYRDGMQRNLMAMQTDYLAADAEGKRAIMAAVRHQYSQTNTSEYPAHLKDFLRDAGIY